MFRSLLLALVLLLPNILPAQYCTHAYWPRTGRHTEIKVAVQGPDNLHKVMTRWIGRIEETTTKLRFVMVEPGQEADITVVGVRSLSSRYRKDAYTDVARDESRCTLVSAIVMVPEVMRSGKEYDPEMYETVVGHEFLHALGFDHKENTLMRDGFGNPEPYISLFTASYIREVYR